MKKKVFIGFAALSVYFGGIAYSAHAESATHFSDVPNTHWAKSAIENAVANGYFKGYSDGGFHPNSPVTKGEMATILSRLKEQPDVVPDAEVTFTDIPVWVKDGLKGAIRKGFITPENNIPNFQANESLTRGELAIWLTNGLAAFDADYGVALKDVINTVVPAREYFTGTLPVSNKSAVAVAMGTGLMSVEADKNFGINHSTTRAEVATILARYIEVLKKKPADFLGLRELREVGLTGTNLTTVTKYERRPKEKMSEAYYEQNQQYLVDFDGIRNKNLKSRYPENGTVQLHNMLIVDPDIKGELRSIYAPVFLRDDQRFNDVSNFAFVNISITPKVDKFDLLRAANLLDSSALSVLGITYPSETLKYGVNMNSLENQLKFEKNVTTTFWGAGAVPKYAGIHGDIHIETEDKKMFNYMLPF